MTARHKGNGPAAIHNAVRCLYITVTEMKRNHKSYSIRNIVHSSLVYGSLQAFSLYLASAVEFQLDAMELDCNSLELDMHWHHSSLKHQ